MRHVCIIVGKTGSGKSTLARTVIERSRRTVIIDPNNEYTDALIVHDISEFLDYFQTEDPPEFRVACRFHDRFEVDPAEMDMLFEAVWEIGNVLLVVEEVDAYIPPLDRDNSFMALISRGRHRAIHILGIAQRVPQFSRALRAQRTTMISFAVDEPDDLQKLVEYGFDAEELSGLSQENHEYALHGIEIERIEF